MKVLIWFLCILAASILNLLLGYATGFYADIVIFWLIVVWAARTLCISWDKRKIAQIAAWKGMSSLEYVKNDIPEETLKFFEKNRGNRHLIKATLKNLLKEFENSRVYTAILLDEYMKPKPTCPTEPAPAFATFPVYIFDAGTHDIRKEIRNVNITKFPPAIFADDNNYYAIETVKDGKKVRIYCKYDKWNAKFVSDLRNTASPNQPPPTPNQ